MGTRKAPRPPIPPPKNGYQPEHSDKPKGNPPGYVLDPFEKALQDQYKILEEQNRIKSAPYIEILESIANNIHADDKARVEACKVLLGHA